MELILPSMAVKINVSGLDNNSTYMSGVQESVFCLFIPAAFVVLT